MIRYLVIFAFAFADQFGLPLPSMPVLLGAGALSRSGRLLWGGAFLAAVCGPLLADVIWYWIGRRRGNKVLNLVCRISLEPDSCVRRTEEVFASHGAKSLLVAKFVPGLNAVAAPMAGVFQMRFWRFVAFDALGGALWAGVYLGLGYVFSEQLEQIAQWARRLGGDLAAVAVVLLAAFILFKYVQRRRFLRSLRVARVSPGRLKEIVDSGEDVQIVDLRHSLDFEADPESVPGAVHIPVEELKKRDERISRDREVVLLCN